MSGTPKDANTASDLQDDLAALRADVAKLTSQLSDMLLARGDTAWRKAKANVDGMVSGVQDQGTEAADALREVGDNFAGAIDDSLKNRPYTTLALALGIGVLFGALLRR